MARKPADEKAVVVPTGSIEQRVSDLETLLASSFVSPVVEGRALARCMTCNAFATRQHRFEHPHAATFYQVSCDACDLRHALSKHAASVITTEPIPNYPEACVELGRRINAARDAVTARFR